MKAYVVKDKFGNYFNGAGFSTLDFCLLTPLGVDIQEEFPELADVDTICVTVEIEEIQE